MMKLLFLSALAIVAAALPTYAADWAVLVCGSNTYSNYRHQADVAHAYQLISGNGIPSDNIITMLYDDVATHYRNPFPGQVFNAPTEAGVPGVDVWAGVQKDYTGKDVTPANFLAVITGNATAVPAGKKVLKSGPNDRVFIFFSDHGGVGLLAFPDKYLYATDLIPALKQMHETRMYQRLVFYIEACEAGSMFAKILPEDIDIYAVTASNPTESSWGTFCPPNDAVNGKHIGSCLGDLFAVNWMANSEEAGPKETLQEQYEVVRNATTKSHVMQYGDVSWTAQPIGDFIGDKSKFSAAVAAEQEARASDKSAVSSRDVDVHLAYYRYLRAEPFSAEQTEALSELRAELDAREAAQQRFLTLSQLFARNAQGLLVHTPANYFKQPSVDAIQKGGVCVKAAVEALRAGDCDYDDHSLQYHRVIVNACGQHLHNEVEGAAFIVAQIEKVCTPFFKNM